MKNTRFDPKMEKNLNRLSWACGLGDQRSKPTNANEHLQTFVGEMKDQDNDGLAYQVKIFCFICDTRARAFVHKIKCHSGYYICEQSGVYMNHRMTLPEINAAPRTDRCTFWLNEIWGTTAWEITSVPVDCWYGVVISSGQLIGRQSGHITKGFE